jgi:hypothetical protein
MLLRSCSGAYMSIARTRRVEVLNPLESVAGAPELPGFVLQLAEIWQLNI